MVKEFILLFASQSMGYWQEDWE
jgi:hypothetical protein